MREGEPPLRDELFTVEQLARHARGLAEGHQLAAGRSGNSLLAQLDDNEEVLRAFNHLTRAMSPTRRITSAAEWLLDNFYLIEEQVQMARRHLPRRYSRELPCLSDGPSAGLPRVYDIVLELIAHVDAQIDEETLSAFIASYQTVTTLTLGELWAVPIMMRLGLIEDLRRIVSRLTTAHTERDLAALWVNRLLDMAENNPPHLVVVVSDMAKSDIPLTPSFVAEFFQLLSHHSSVLHLARSWVEHRLLDHGLSIERMIDLESQSQAADQVSVSHCIASLRFLGAMDWKEFVETMSLVDSTLRADPAGFYRQMDFTTRDQYRHAVEAISRHSEHTETDVARLAVRLADDAARQHGGDDRSAHVGYYLIGKGQPTLQAMTKARQPWRARPPGFLCGRHWRADAACDRRIHVSSPDAWRARLGVVAVIRQLCGRGQPIGGGVDELAVWTAGAAPPPPPPGLRRRHRAGLPHRGGRSHHADERGRDGPAHRNHGDSLPSQSGRAPALRVAHRLPRCRGGTSA
jgi:hypothetical protein